MFRAGRGPHRKGGPDLDRAGLELGIFRNYLLENKVANEKTLNAEELSVEEEVQKAIEFAESSPEPEWQDLIDTIYVDEYRMD